MFFISFSCITMPYDLLIESKSRLTESTSSADFVWQGSNAFDNVTHLEITSLRVDTTMYNLISGRSTIYFTDNSTLRTAALTAGYYTGTQLASLLQTGMNAANSGFQTYTVTYNTNTYKFTISAGANFIMNWTGQATTTPYELFGFTNANTASGTSVTSTNAAALNPYQFLILSIREFDNTIYTGFDSTSTTNPGCTFVIPNTNGLAEQLSWIPPVRNVIKARPTGPVTQLHVKLVDSTGTTIPLNNGNWAFVLRIWTHDEDPFIDIHPKISLGKRRRDLKSYEENDD
jgi:hypothetical protein